MVSKSDDDNKHLNRDFFYDTNVFRPNHGLDAVLAEQGIPTPFYFLRQTYYFDIMASRFSFLKVNSVTITFIPSLNYNALDNHVKYPFYFGLDRTKRISMTDPRFVKSLHDTIVVTSDLITEQTFLFDESDSDLSLGIWVDYNALEWTFVPGIFVTCPFSQNPQSVVDGEYYTHAVQFRFNVDFKNLQI